MSQPHTLNDAETGNLQVNRTSESSNSFSSTQSKTQNVSWYLNRTTSSILLIQAVLAIVLVATVRYSDKSNAGDIKNGMFPLIGGFDHEDLPNLEKELRDVLVLATLLLFISNKVDDAEKTCSILKNHLVIFSFTVQYSLILTGLIYGNGVELSILRITDSINCYISFIVCTSTLDYLHLIQLIVLLTFYVPAQVTLKFLIEMIQISDPGVTFSGHVYGSIFGITIFTIFRFKKYDKDISKTTPDKNDAFFVIISFFLSQYLPSIALSKTKTDAHRRILIHSLFAFLASISASVALGPAFRKNRKLAADDLPNAMIGCWVAMSSISHLMIGGYGQVIIGFLTTAFYLQIKFLLKRKFPDDQNNHWIAMFVSHGVCGILGAILGIIVAFSASPKNGYYGYSLYKLYPARAPKASDPESYEIQNYLDIRPNVGRSAGEQAGYQAVGLILALTIAIVGGSITGLLMKIKIIDKWKSLNCFQRK